jgi:hypothetical protein
MKEQKYIGKRLLHKGKNHIIHSAVDSVENRKVIIREPRDNAPNSKAVKRLLNAFEMGKRFRQGKIMK